jgi:hypothetical protein
MEKQAAAHGFPVATAKSDTMIAVPVRALTLWKALIREKLIALAAPARENK